ncbi:hypothetical protein [Pontibacter sp. HSC-36F09]|uniref:hypothetical protein n=1 Tax=Pontibacter sp. HSC-36F09 TaxID=2910966 RepID=UPI00209C9EF9|nr:hypothetical protein [Pontibacter sp. HSC-36F09]MCP2042662.1 hypothetical protein [Pontibacter sp. HSC-36F09]
MIEIALFVYHYCTDFVINLANLLGLSYYEINALFFVLLYPAITVMLFGIFFLQKVRLVWLRYRLRR